MTMRNAECGMWNGGRAVERRGPFNSAFRIPHSALAVEHRRLFRAPRRREPKVLIRGSRSAAAAGGAGQETALHEERLVYFLECPGILAHGCGDGREPDRPALELFDDRLQDPAVHVVQAELVHVQPFP